MLSNKGVIILNALNKISASIEKITGYFLAFAFASMTVIYFSSIIARFAFNSGISWAEEFTRYMNISLVMLGSATVARHNGHTNISVLELSVKKGARKFVVIFQQIITIIFFAFAAIIGFKFASTATHVSANLRLPLSFMYNLMSIAFILLAFQAIVSILNMINTKEEK